MKCIKIGLPPYRILNDQEIKTETMCEPGNECVDYVENLFARAGILCVSDPRLYTEDRRVLLCEVDGKRFGFIRAIGFPEKGAVAAAVMRDYGLKTACMWWPRREDRELSGLIPIGPPAFGFRIRHFSGIPEDHWSWEWSLYDWAQHSLKYTASGSVIYSHLIRKLHPKPGMGHYRDLLREVLLKMTDYSVECQVTSPLDFLRRLCGSRIAIFAPGITPSYPDRNMLISIACGVATVMPTLDYTFPGEKLIPGVHYLACKEDFSDIGSIVATDPKVLIQIGNNGRSWFRRNLTPLPLSNFIIDKVEKQ